MVQEARGATARLHPHGTTCCGRIAGYWGEGRPLSPLRSTFAQPNPRSVFAPLASNEFLVPSLSHRP